MTKRQPKVHEIKCWRQWFAGVVERSKTFEIRKNDRDYRSGDALRLIEWDNLAGKPTGRVALCKVLDVLQDFDGLTRGYCAMGVFFLNLETKHTSPEAGAEEWP